MPNARIQVIAGGTQFHVRPHLALSAPAYGGTGRRLKQLVESHGEQVDLHLTTMAGGPSTLETPSDVARLVNELVADDAVRILFMPVAIADFEGSVLDGGVASASGLDQPRLKTSQGNVDLRLTPAPKIIGNIRKTRKNLFLVGFKTTSGATGDEQFAAGLRLLKSASCNLVLANDLRTRLSMVITPEQASYHASTDRQASLAGLVEMALLRSRGTFTRSTVVDGAPVPWSSPLVPETLRAVVDHCIERGAYKPFLGSTVGHFAVRLEDGRFLTSRRKTNFNQLSQVGLVLIEAIGDDRVIAHGSRPSVGGQSQRIIFREHPEADCIVHFHCPLKPGVSIPTREQRPHECGSHQCGANTSAGLTRFGNLLAVMLDKHGPNVVFHRSIDPREVIDFIEAHFDLSASTAGYQFVDSSAWSPSSAPTTV
ncbi:MAG: phosphopantothenoylcysteine decarboxylase [Polyangiaceae bacterium]